MHVTRNFVGTLLSGSRSKAVTTYELGFITVMEQRCESSCAQARERERERERERAIPAIEEGTQGRRPNKRSGRTRHNRAM